MTALVIIALILAWVVSVIGACHIIINWKQKLLEIPDIIIGSAMIFAGWVIMFVAVQYLTYY